MQTFISVVLALAGFVLAMLGGEQNSPALVLLGAIILAVGGGAAAARAYDGSEE